MDDVTIREDQLRTLAEVGAVQIIELAVHGGTKGRHLCRVLVGDVWRDLVSVRGKPREWTDLDRLADFAGRHRGSGIVRLAFSELETGADDQAR